MVNREERTPEFPGENRYFPVQGKSAAEAWVGAGGIALLEISERSYGNRKSQMTPHIRVWGPEVQLEAWAAQEGRPWNWAKRGEDGGVYFEMSGRAAAQQLLMFGVRRRIGGPGGSGRIVDRSPGS